MLAQSVSIWTARPISSPRCHWCSTPPIPRKHDKILIARRANWNCPGLWVLRCVPLDSGRHSILDDGWVVITRLMTESTDTQNVSCAELGILGPVVALVSLQQALWAIKYSVDHSLPWAQLYIMDAWSGSRPSWRFPSGLIVSRVTRPRVKCTQPSVLKIRRTRQLISAAATAMPNIVVIQKSTVPSEEPAPQ